MYRIAVPVKQVPDMERVRFDTEAGRVDRSSAPGVVNPVDLHALETALRIRDTRGQRDGHIDGTSAGGVRAEGMPRTRRRQGRTAGGQGVRRR